MVGIGVTAGIDRIGRRCMAPTNLLEWKNKTHEKFMSFTINFNRMKSFIWITHRNSYQWTMWLRHVSWNLHEVDRHLSVPISKLRHSIHFGLHRSISRYLSWINNETIPFESSICRRYTIHITEKFDIQIATHRFRFHAFLASSARLCRFWLHMCWYSVFTFRFQSTPTLPLFFDAIWMRSVQSPNLLLTLKISLETLNLERKKSEFISNWILYYCNMHSHYVPKRQVFWSMGNYSWLQKQTKVKLEMWLLLWSTWIIECAHKVSVCRWRFSRK